MKLWKECKLKEVLANAVAHAVHHPTISHHTKMVMDSAMEKIFQSVEAQISKNKKFNHMCKLEKNSNIYVSNIHLSNLIEILSKVGKIDVITPDNTAMITFD